MSSKPEAESRSTADSPKKARRSMNPESLKNLRRGDQPPERHVEAMAQVIDPSAVPEEVSLYEDMRHVRRFPKALDRTAGQRMARKWFGKDLKGWMAKYADLEKATTGVKPPEPGKAAEYDGEGPCPACNRPAEEELPGPEFMEPEWSEMQAILKHKDAILRILPHIDQFDGWLATRAAG
jgi:hypothetical protein